MSLPALPRFPTIPCPAAGKFRPGRRTFSLVAQVVAPSALLFVVVSSMSLRTQSLWLPIIGCIVEIVVGGCQTPWTAAPSFTRIGAANHAAPGHGPSAKSAISSPADSIVADAHPAMPDPGMTGVNDAAMADVMKQVQRVGATDPAAQQMLLDELQRSKPELWPLVAQHFRASLDYHEQLAAKSPDKAATVAGATTAEIGESASSGREAAVASATASSSGRIGDLVDPRGVRTDAPTYQSAGVATPANMSPPLDPKTLALAAAAPQPPQTLTTDATAQPILLGIATAPNTTPPQQTTTPAITIAADAPHTAKQAIYESPVDGTTDVKLALATSPVNQAASPADPNSPDWRQHVDEAIKDLEQQLPDAPQTTAEVHQQVSLRLLELLAGRTEEALKPIPQISHEEQDYWSGQIYALATYLDHHSLPDDKRRAAASVAHLDEAVSHLRELGSLALRNLTFCKNVYDYGCYEPYDNPQFTPGQQVTLYVEVENYHSDSTDKGYCTSLGTSYEVFDDHGKRLEGGDFPDVEDCCRSRRRDFHIQYGLAIPKKLEPGKYRLDLNMKDRRGDKLGHASIDFEIHSKS
jgi:hypothetical protein